MNCNPPEAPPNHVHMCGYWRAPESPQVALAFPYRQISCVSHHRFVTTARLHAFVSLSGCVSLPVPVDFSGGSKKSDAAFSKVPWTLVQGTIHTRTLKNKLPFPVHVAGVLDQNRPGRAFLRPTLSGDVPSLSLDHGKKRTGPPDHRTSFLEVATSSSSVRSAGVDRG